MSKPLLIIALLTLSEFSACAQSAEQKMTPEQYIDQFKDAAIKEMRMYNIPASITLAQGMLESDNGNSKLAILANNHFGIKCHEWNGPTYTKNDNVKNECFRKYSSANDSYNDHSQFLKSHSRYSILFELKSGDYKGWAKGLRKTGYATDPSYPQCLLRLIDKYKLYQYDEGDDDFSSNNNTSLKKSSASEKIKNHEIFSSHFTKYIIVNPGDNFSKIAEETDKDLWQLYKFNDLEPTDKLVPGQKIYIQPKRKSAKEPFHVVQRGETMRSISQLHSIKLKSLYDKNNMKTGEEPVVGQQLNMH
jgi:LysM repeat protein